MSLVLRPYQQAAVERTLWAFDKLGNDLISLPTGSGKSLVIAEIARAIDGNIVILQPTREILEQNMAKLAQYVPAEEIGVFSAALNRKEVRPYTFATIQTAYKRPELFPATRLVIIDEAHSFDPKNTTGMFNQFLAGLGNPKVIGLTATPYRNTLGYQWQQSHYAGEKYLEAVTTVKLVNRLKERFWARLMFNLTVGELLAAGYLCPLRYYHHRFINQEDMPLNKSKSDFDLEEVTKRIMTREDDILRVLRRAENAFKSCLIFCATVGQAEKLAAALGGAVVTAKTKPAVREKIVADFKTHKIKSVFNVGCLTTGFDHPALDFIGLLRPTRSLALYTQMLGRALRNAPGKEYGMVTDFTDTVRQLGRVETVRVERVLSDGGYKWELLSETGSWHNRLLYSWKV